MSYEVSFVIFDTNVDTGETNVWWSIDHQSIGHKATGPETIQVEAIPHIGEKVWATEDSFRLVNGPGMDSPEVGGDDVFGDALIVDDVTYWFTNLMRSEYYPETEVTVFLKSNITWVDETWVDDLDETR